MVPAKQDVIEIETQNVYKTCLVLHRNEERLWPLRAQRQKWLPLASSPATDSMGFGGVGQRSHHDPRCLWALTSMASTAPALQ